MSKWPMAALVLSFPLFITKAVLEFKLSLNKASLIINTPTESPAKILVSSLKNPAFIAANAPCRVAMDEVFSVPMAMSIAW